jgi:hypothetical protein
MLSANLPVLLLCPSEESRCHITFKQTTNNRLPDYNGTEKWKVWINRFEAVADLHGWSRKERLSELLPRLQGTAGDFFNQFTVG